MSDTWDEYDCRADAAKAERKRICTLLEALDSEPGIDIDGNPIDAVSRYDLDMLISGLRDGSL